MNQITSFVLRIILLPVSLLRLIGRGIGMAIKPVTTPLSRQIDESDSLSTVINSLASSMASQRGLPLIIGTVLLVLSLILHGIIIIGLVATNSFDRNLYWLCLPVAVLHVGVLAGFTGAMLAIPLGQSYKEEQ